MRAAPRVAAAREHLARLVAASSAPEAMLMHAFVGNAPRPLPELEAELAAADPDGALYGLFCGVKDVLKVDGLPCVAGSGLPAEAFAQLPEAGAVMRLRRAGAVVLGRTVTPEFAHRVPGPTRNPWDARHSPGGSSSGSAAAVAAGLVDFALGTQTNGSVTRPATFCGVVGFKPSAGRLPTDDGLVYFSRSIDQLGLFTRSVEELERIACVLVDGWRTEPAATAEAEVAPCGNRTATVLGVPDGPLLDLASGPSVEAFERGAAILAASGPFTVPRVPALSDLSEISERHVELAVAEMAAYHKEMGWASDYASCYSDLMTDALARGAALGPQLTELWQDGERSMLTLRQALEAHMQQQQTDQTDCSDPGEPVDYWLTPASVEGVPPLFAERTTGSPAMARPWTHAGMPSLALPSGLFADGVGGGALPHGLQLVGRWGDDEGLLACGAAVASALAQGTGLAASAREWPPAGYRET
jgi:Asp-tRNA(Asn)/Glu-tRNA(Gln) amidotransferase A subunit family amidase